MYSIDGEERNYAIPLGVLIGSKAQTLADSPREELGARLDLVDGVGLARQAACVGVPGGGEGVAAVALVVEELF